jgi:hypothetical protein
LRLVVVCERQAARHMQPAPRRPVPAPVARRRDGARMGMRGGQRALQ